jgi:carboxylate-amine ligase
VNEPLHLFEGFGVELEYMIVNRESLSVQPVADEVLRAVAGEYTSEVEFGDIAWSNELALHVIELKTNGPASSLNKLPALFHANTQRIDTVLGEMDARLMPGAMHPWMNPFTETKLWPHDYNPVYETFNKIFDCRGHGWSNLQSVHINLPFYDDREFGRLHAAIRLVLPILPALAASSPVLDSKPTGIMDNRLEVYRTNAVKIPSISGRVIPEQVFTRKEYEQQLLQRLYDDIAPYDPEGILQEEWLNARGAIARFDRNTIEIRVLDIQECPLADLSIAAAAIGVIEALTGEFSANLILQQSWEVDPLYTLLLETTRDAESTIISNAKYLRMMRYPEGNRCRASELWQHLIETVLPASSVYDEKWEAPLETILTRGTLARRISRALGENPSREKLYEVYGTLCNCLAENKMFL